METATILTGCSSFNEYRWKGVFYPDDLPRKQWFAHYCKYFNTYEMNSSFYKFPTEKGLSKWYVDSPPDFQFSVKMFKGVTHFKKFKECEQLVREFYDVCRENLEEKLACILFQLPPSFSYSEARLEQILDSLDYSFTNAIEFRNISWWNNDVYAALAEKGVIFCNVSYPNLPEDLVRSSNIGYVRLHGVPRLFYSAYGSNYLENLHQSIVNQNWEKTIIRQAKREFSMRCSFRKSGIEPIQMSNG